MSKIFYRYNPETLSYERVYPTKIQRLWALLRQLLLGAVIGIGVFAFTSYQIDSPKEKELKKENKLLLAQYQILSRRIDESDKILKELQERDNQLYRATFNADPIPDAIRRPGFGGTNRYESLMELNNAELVIATTRKLDIMNKALYVQSNSYDELVNLIKTKGERMNCIPAVMPISPTELKQVSSGFGMRVHPVTGTLRPHTGIDLNAKAGTPIYVTGDGVVESARWDGGYGNCVIVDHGFGFKTLYSHCKDMLVRKGQRVTRGQKIGTVGMTGIATGNHLHYEVRVKGKPDNPAKYFFLTLSPAEYNEMLYVSENR